MGRISKGTIIKTLCVILAIMIIFGVPACLFFDVPGLVFAEIDTLLYVDEFDDPELFRWEILPFESVDEIKVLEYYDDYAKVYYVLDNYQTAYVNHYEKVNGEWQRGPYGYHLWSEEFLSGNKEGPAAYWWHYRLREKNRPISKKYQTKAPIDPEDILRHPEEPIY